ncbi:hypothetical protein TWF132_000171 [Orbilia oligospora]|nr:hypothetical protein TWF132_000171 [Orbilia oligospora]
MQSSNNPTEQRRGMRRPLCTILAAMYCTYLSASLRVWYTLRLLFSLDFLEGACNIVIAVQKAGPIVATFNTWIPLYPFAKSAVFQSLDWLGLMIFALTRSNEPSSTVQCKSGRTGIPVPLMAYN